MTTSTSSPEHPDLFDIDHCVTSSHPAPGGLGRMDPVDNAVFGDAVLVKALEPDKACDDESKAPDSVVDDDATDVIQCVKTANQTMWLKNDKLHQDDDKPAIVNVNGDKYWYQDGKLHRDGGGPAIIRDGGVQEWYKDGVRFRADGKPLFVHPAGFKFWIENGEIFREFKGVKRSMGFTAGGVLAFACTN